MQNKKQRGAKVRRDEARRLSKGPRCSPHTAGGPLYVRAAAGLSRHRATYRAVLFHLPSLSLSLSLVQYGEEEVCSDRLDADFPDIDLSQLDASDFNCLSELHWCSEQSGSSPSSSQYNTGDPEFFEVSGVGVGWHRSAGHLSNKGERSETLSPLWQRCRFSNRGF